MNWKEFKTWLDKEVVIQQENNIIFNETAEEKYDIASLTNSLTFMVEFNHFYRSLEATLDKEEKFWHLPAYKENKSWEQLFPNIEKVRFGGDDNEKVLEQETHDKLGEIYNDWQEHLQKEESEKLADDLFKESDDFKKLTEELVAYAFLANLPDKKRQAEISKLKKWLSKYEKLPKEKKEDLEDAKENVDKLLDMLKDSQKEVEAKNNSWNIGQIGQSIVAGVVVLIGVGFIMNFFKKKE